LIIPTTGQGPRSEHGLSVLEPKAIVKLYLGTDPPKRGSPVSSSLLPSRRSAEQRIVLAKKSLLEKIRVI
jgi:hypothetical protein